ncbi:hypothetical protein SUGI_0141190 [Cryptomeria japonica]|nr:hypothetical protein SUGI_0141190 [Cryptomeria japonica]
MVDRRDQLVVSIGCSRLGAALSSPKSFFGGVKKSSSVPMSPAMTSSVGGHIHQLQCAGPFSGFIICVTGLSKEARNQVQAATERMGGHYSPDLHPRFGGRKFEHALKHGLKRGLFIVTLAWFVNCVKTNARLDESAYSVNSIVHPGLPLEEFSQLVAITNAEHSCLPLISHEDSKSLSKAVQPFSQSSSKDISKNAGSVLSGYCLYIDMDVPSELHKKVAEAAQREGATCVDRWFIGCNATHVVCEGPSFQRYVGYTTNLVTPLWILKTTKERFVQRLVHFSADLARQIAIMLDNFQSNHFVQDENIHGRGYGSILSKHGICDEKYIQTEVEEREQRVSAAKACVRRRRGPRMQPCRTIPRPLTPSSLLDSICWSISEPFSTACIYMDNPASTLIESGPDMEGNDRMSVFFDARDIGRYSDARSGISEDEVLTRSLKESEKREIIYRGLFLTILFPIDRFGEMGPSSRTFFSEKGFTRMHILEHIYSFYQENMSPDEIGVSIHTDSKHADHLRSLYASREAVELGYVAIKRSEFIGSRRSFEGLKRVSRENTGQVYELWLGA